MITDNADRTRSKLEDIRNGGRDNISNFTSTVECESLRTAAFEVFRTASK